MQSLFSSAARTRLDQIVRPGVLCVFDFDGTLAPITDDPDRSRLPGPVLERLVALSACAPVAILTGRSLADIRQRLDFEPKYVVGNHGLEGIPGSGADRREQEACCRGWRIALDQRLQDRDKFDSGIFIEDKQVSLSVHYRAARDPAVAAARLQPLWAELDPSPRVIAGKCVFNLLPRSAADKGWAMERLIEFSEASGAVYVGDDVTDEDVFRLRRPELLSVRVEDAADSAAEFYIPAFDDITRLLDELLLRLRR